MKPLIALLTIALLLAGCGNAAEEIAERAAEAGAGGDVDVDIEGDTGEFTIESEDGSQTVDVGSGELPSELSMPIPDGYDVIASSVIEQADETIVTALLVFPGGDVEEIAAHFDDYYADRDGTSRTETSFEGGTQYVWLTENGASVGVVARDGEDAVEVTITEISGS